MVCSRYPRECQYYEKVLKRKCLLKLKHNVWENKTKWKLIQIADIYLKQKLLRKYLDLWLLFLHLALEKKTNQEAADFLYENKLKRKGIAAFKQNAQCTSEFAGICKRKIDWNVKFRTWHQWKHYTQKRLKIREIKSLANKIRNERIVIRYFYLWSIRFKEKQFLQTVYAKVVQHHNNKLKQKFFNLWKNFKNKKICKRRIEKLSTVCYEDKLKEKSFGAWKEVTTKKITYRNQAEEITVLRQNYLLTNYLNRWWMRYERLVLQRDRENNYMAVQYHDKKLLQKGLEAFCKTRKKRKSLKEKMYIFNENKTKMYISLYLSIWENRVTEKIQWTRFESKADKYRQFYLISMLLNKLIKEYEARIEEREKFWDVVRYSNSIITHKVFKSWQNFVSRKKYRRVQNENADEFYWEKLTQKYFMLWKRFVFWRCQKKVADAYYKNVILSRAMNQWKNFLKDRKSILIKATNLELKHKLIVVKSIFQEWKKEVELMKKKKSIAVGFDGRGKLSKTFGAWKQYTQTKTERKLRYSRNCTILKSIIIKSTLYRWQEIHSFKLNLNSKVAQLKTKQGKRVMAKYFRTWYSFVEKMKNIQQTVDSYSRIRSAIVLEQYIVNLTRAVSTKRLFKRKVELARTTHEVLVKRKYMRKWISFICWKRERVLRCVVDDSQMENLEKPEKSSQKGKPTRRKPIIPSYLKEEFGVGKDTTKYLTTERNEYSIGRKNCDFVLSDDSSISRKHCTIHIAKKSECPFDVNTPTGVWIVDEQSKYGTFLKNNNEWVKLKPNENKKLTDRCVIRFGIMENIWSLEYKPVIACTSGIQTEQKKEVANTLKLIDGEVRNTCSKDCSLVVVNEITLTVKVVLALINGVPIVKTDYLQKLVDCIRNQTQLPDYKDYKPEIKESILDSSLVSLDYNKTRKELFKGKKFVIPTKKQLETLKDVIVSAGGNVELFSTTSSKDQLGDGNVILIQLPVNNSMVPEELNKSFKQLSGYLKSKYGKRIVPESEIAQAVAYSSTEKYCNPNSKCFSLSKTNKEHDLGDVLVEETPDVEKMIPGACVISSSASLDSQSGDVFEQVNSQSSIKSGRKRHHSPDIVDVDFGKKRVLDSDEPSSKEKHKKYEEKSQTKKEKNTTITSFFKKQPKPSAKEPPVVELNDNEFWNCDNENNKFLKRKLSTQTNNDDESCSKKKAKYPSDETKKTSFKTSPETSENVSKPPTRVEARRTSSVLSIQKVDDDEDKNLEDFFEREKTESASSGIDELNSTIYSLTLISSAYLKEDGSLVDPPSKPVNVKKFKKQNVLSSSTPPPMKRVDDEIMGDDWIEPHPIQFHVSVSDGNDW